MSNLHYSELKIQNYLENENISVKEAQNLFRYRTRVAKFKENFKNNYDRIECPLCLDKPDTQAHCMQCPIIISISEVTTMKYFQKKYQRK